MDEGKYLLIGSAAYAPQWWAEHGKWFKAHRYMVCAINNAWAVTREQTDRWYRSTDFFQKGHVLPTTDDMRALGCVSGGVLSDHLRWPFWYRDGFSTMCLNCLYDLVNRVVLYRLRSPHVVVVGSDLVYPPGEATHFYEGGTPDPLRKGDDVLRRALDWFYLAAQASNVPVVNASTGDSLLPFPRWTEYRA